MAVQRSTTRPLLVMSWREVRAHPSRWLAPFLAIAVAAAFLAAAAVVSATEAHAVRERSNLIVSRADAVVEVRLWNVTGTRRDQAAQTTEFLLGNSPDVLAYGQVSRARVVLSSATGVTKVMLTALPYPPELQWVAPAQGRLPQGTHEVMLSRATAKQLQVGIGATIHSGNRLLPDLTVCGIADDLGYDDTPAYVTPILMNTVEEGFEHRGIGTTVDPTVSYRTTPLSAGHGVGYLYLVKLKQPGHAAEFTDRLAGGLAHAGYLKIDAKARTASDVRAEALAGGSESQHSLDAALAGAAAAALIVGALMIRTTFEVLVAHRRRQVGLLRSLGASRGQVWSRFAAESALLGLVGCLAGLALGILAAFIATRYISGSERFGLVVPPLTFAATALALVTTLAAALGPLRGATRVAPLAALQEATSTGAVRRPRLVAGAAVTALVVGIVALTRAALPQPLSAWLRIDLAALGSVALITAALGAVGLWAPAALLRAAVVVPHAAVAARLGLRNSARSPARVGATVSAVALAATLITAVNVATGTGLAGADAQLDAQYPVDVALQSARQEPDLPGNASGPHTARDAQGNLPGFGAAALASVRATPGVADAALFPVTEPVLVRYGQTTVQWMPLSALDSSSRRLVHRDVTVPPGAIGLSADTMRGAHVAPGDHISVETLLGDGKLDLTVTECDVSEQLAVVAPETITRLRAATQPGLMLVKLGSSDAAASLATILPAKVIATDPGVTLSGSAEHKSSVHKLIDAFALLLSVLLGIAAVVSLTGVANMLALMALERRTEFGLLRALGMARMGLWRTLLAEAVALVAIAALLGLVTGSAVGYGLGRAVDLALGLPVTGPRGNPWIVAGFCLLLLVAGAVASLLPGRHASKTPPAAALPET